VELCTPKILYNEKLPGNLKNYRICHCVPKKPLMKTRQIKHGKRGANNVQTSNACNRQRNSEKYICMYIYIHTYIYIYMFIYIHTRTRGLGSKMLFVSILTSRPSQDSENSGCVCEDECSRQTEHSQKSCLCGPKQQVKHKRQHFTKDDTLQNRVCVDPKIEYNTPQKTQNTIQHPTKDYIPHRITPQKRNTTKHFAKDNTPHSRVCVDP